MATTFAEAATMQRKAKKSGTKRSKFDIRCALSEMQGTMKRGAILQRPVFMFKHSEECTPLYISATKMKKMTPESETAASKDNRSEIGTER